MRAQPGTSKLANSSTLEGLKAEGEAAAQAPRLPGSGRDEQPRSVGDQDAKASLVELLEDRAVCIQAQPFTGQLGRRAPRIASSRWVSSKSRGCQRLQRLPDRLGRRRHNRGGADAMLGLGQDRIEGAAHAQMP